MSTDPSAEPTLVQFESADLEAIVERFEISWRDGRRPDILELLPVPPQLRAAVLRELVMIDLEYLLLNGERARVEDYFRSFPELIADEPFCLKFIFHEFTLRRRQESALKVDEYRSRFPQWAEKLAGLLIVSSYTNSHRRRRFAARLNCPHCHNAIEVVSDSVDDSVTCPSCGSAVHLDADRSMTWNKQRLPTIAHFELLEAVGRGAFGTVYKARDLELQRIVAVKIPRSGVLETDADEERFIREARNVAQLQHPGIVAIHSISRSDTFPFLVSEFVDGVTLSQYMAAKRLSSTEAARLVRLVAIALQYAHDHGVVHRDLKPSNIMLAADGTPRLMDFGLAKRDATEITMTLDGQILGTPAYMSPEQARGQAHQADARSDIYSTGVILFQVLTGELPFRGDQLMIRHQVLHDEPPNPRKLCRLIPRDLDTICMKCMAKEPARRYSTAGDLAADLQRFLEGKPILARPVGAVERGWRWIKRNPVFAGMSATILLLLSGIAMGSTVGMFYFAEQKRRETVQLAEVRKQKLNAEAQGRAALEARGRAVAAQQEEARQRGIAETNARTARQQSELAIQTLSSVVFEVQESLALLPGSALVRARILSAILPNLDKVSQQFSVKSTIDRHSVAALTGLADAILQLGQLQTVTRQRDGAINAARFPIAADPVSRSAVQTAERLYLRAHEIAKRLATDLPMDITHQKDLAITLDRLGEVYVRLGRTEDSVRRLEESLRMRKVLAESAPRDVELQDQLASALVNLSSALLTQGQTTEALERINHGVTIRRTLVDVDSNSTQRQRELAVALDKLGDVYLALGRTKDAHAQFDECLRIMRERARTGRDDVQRQRDLTVAIDKLGSALLSLGRGAEALGLFEEGLQISRRMAAEDPSDADTQRDLAIACLRRGDALVLLENWDDARTQFEEHLKITRGLVDADPGDIPRQRDLVAALNRLGDFFLSTGQASEALRQFESCLKICRDLSDADPRDVQKKRDLSIAINRTGEALVALERPAEALTRFEDCLTIVRSLVADDPQDAQKQRDLSVAMNKLGGMLLSLGRVDEARARLDDGLKICRELADADPDNVQNHRNLANAQISLGHAELAVGRYAEASSRYSDALAPLNRMISRQQNVVEAMQFRTYCQNQIHYCANAPKAVGEWDSLLKSDPHELPDLLTIRGSELGKRGRIADVVQSAEKLCDLEPKSDNLYNAACLYALCSKISIGGKSIPTEVELSEQTRFRDLALTCLKEAIAAGYTDLAYLAKDPDLAPLKKLPEFQALFK